ncbi:MAG: hypothetical protein J7L14_03470 [Candidatus Diapherotrites archaeon]|nr:hypothetical protein [Candidatus Diapherotrites archaeon]
MDVILCVKNREVKLRLVLNVKNAEESRMNPYLLNAENSDGKLRSRLPKLKHVAKKTINITFFLRGSLRRHAYTTKER